MDGDNVESIVKLLQDKEDQLEMLRERERSVFYSDIRKSLISILSETRDVKRTTSDYRIFKSHVKTTLLVMNMFWGFILVFVYWLLKH